MVAAVGVFFSQSGQMFQVLKIKKHFVFLILCFKLKCVILWWHQWEYSPDSLEPWTSQHFIFATFLHTDIAFVMFV